MRLRPAEMRCAHGRSSNPKRAKPVILASFADEAHQLADEIRLGEQAITPAPGMDAVRRAAPFGDVSRLPRPWKFSETFLFNDERKFKPRTLDS